MKEKKILDELKVMERVVFLDSETTGLDAKKGDKIVELGAIEYINGKEGECFYLKINPEREIPDDAFLIHGISDDDVEDEKKFYQIVDDFISFIDGATVVIHNAPFDTGFINSELMTSSRRNDKKYGKISDYCTIVDSLEYAKLLMPSKKNNLDALSNRFSIDKTERVLHGALIDAKILAGVYDALLRYEKTHNFKHIEKSYFDKIPDKKLNLEKRPRVVSFDI